jgi:hypothetical protein
MGAFYLFGFQIADLGILNYPFIVSSLPSQALATDYTPSELRRSSKWPAMNPILNYVEFRTNHEPNVVHGVVRLSWRPKTCKV